MEVQASPHATAPYRPRHRTHPAFRLPRPPRSPMHPRSLRSCKPSWSRRTFSSGPQRLRQTVHPRRRSLPNPMGRSGGTLPGPTGRSGGAALCAGAAAKLGHSVGLHPGRLLQRQGDHGRGPTRAMSTNMSCSCRVIEGVRPPHFRQPNSTRKALQAIGSPHTPRTHTNL